MKFITNYGKSLDDHRVVRWPERGWPLSGGEVGVNGGKGDTGARGRARNR